MTAARRLAAILAADVAGYSRLMGADEEGTLERLRALRRELVNPKIAEHHGRIIKTTESPQHKLHWLAEQALSWSGLPVVTVRPTVFLEGFFLASRRCERAGRQRAGAADGRRQDLARLIGRCRACRRGDPR
jgi:uncharacterized protein YbjT (DUF2867 family)